MSDLGEWERVHTVNDFWDQPRQGFADFRGKPHAYVREWDESADDYASTYLVSPVSQEQLKLAKEQWAIFDGKHTPLSVDMIRNAELEPLVKEALNVDKIDAVRVLAEFRGARVPLDMQVRWRVP